VPRIGIGVTTTDSRTSHFDEWWMQYSSLCSSDNKLFIARNQNNIAAAKNLCLIALEDCDYIFLFDDDCFIKKEGLFEFCIEEHKRTGEHHFMYLSSEHHRFWKVEHGMKYYFDCGGVFLFLTKEVINKVGGFHKGYNRYGFEHAGYSHRIHAAGLTSSFYMMPVGLQNYLHALDYDGDWKGMTHYPSWSKDAKDIIESVQKNKEIFQEDIKQISQPL